LFEITIVNLETLDGLKLSRQQIDDVTVQGHSGEQNSETKCDYDYDEAPNIGPAFREDTGD
jgi:hypothetical protein